MKILIILFLEIKLYLQRNKIEKSVLKQARNQIVLENAFSYSFSPAEGKTIQPFNQFFTTLIVMGT